MANSTEQLLQTENKYLVKIVGLAVAALVSTLIFIGKWQVDAINKLSDKMEESNIVNNNRFNAIENRMTSGQEKAVGIVEAFRNEHQRLAQEDIKLWKAIEKLQDKR